MLKTYLKLFLMTTTVVEVAPITSLLTSFNHSRQIHNNDTSTEVNTYSIPLELIIITAVVSVSVVDAKCNDAII